MIATTAALPSTDRRMMQLVWEHLYPALCSAGDASAADETRLADRMASLAIPVRQGAVHMAGDAKGRERRYRLDLNPEDGITEIALTFGEDTCRFVLRDARGEHTIVAGLGHNVESVTTMSGALLHHSYEPDQSVVVARGVWINDQQFGMTWRFVEMAFSDTITCTFDGDRLQFDRRVNTNSAGLTRPTLTGTLKQS